MWPQTVKVVALRRALTERSPVFHDACLEDRPMLFPEKGQVLIKIQAVSFNHRDLWIRKGQYPGIIFGSVFGADGVGTVVGAGDPSDPLVNRRVFLVPMRGWEKATDAPESTFAIMGGGVLPGTFTDYIVVDRNEVVLAPDYLDDEHLAAWPLAGVTAWRAVTVNAQVQNRDKILITGIGGGVALLAMQICLAKGATVFVTSGSESKIRRALALGAKAGFKYTIEKWPDELGQTLAAEHAELDAVIDSGGGEIVSQVSKYLKPGGKLVCYGMTAKSKITFTMREVLRNQQLRGSTMGSHVDLIEATKFMTEHRLVPIVSDILYGLEQYEEGFNLLSQGDRFGKVVIKIDDREKARGRL